MYAYHQFCKCVQHTYFFKTKYFTNLLLKFFQTFRDHSYINIVHMCISNLKQMILRELSYEENQPTVFLRTFKCLHYTKSYCVYSAYIGKALTQI